MKNKIFLIAPLLLCSCAAEQSFSLSDITDRIESGDYKEVNAILEQNSANIDPVRMDSIKQTMDRLKADFPYTIEEGTKLIAEKYPFVTQEIVQKWIDFKYIEVKKFDGVPYMFRKAVSNLKRVVPELSIGDKHDSFVIQQGYEELAANAIAAAEKGIADTKTVTIKFTVDVKEREYQKKDLLRVWIPCPRESSRQSNFKLISSSDSVTFSEDSDHNSMYMEKRNPSGQAEHFEVVYSYDVKSQYVSPETIMNNKKAYDTESELYKKYTSSQYPHININEKMKNLAMSIVGTETDPFKQASLIYDWIDTNYPWAGAREYSTIPNIPEYVLNSKHGDCGQVSLLYITLLRNLGIPAKWESGFMLHPGRDGMHDWTEVYYEGIGWVPADMSFGNIQTAKDENIRNFYKTGLDFYRLAANNGYGDKFSPEKKFIRSETVDFQLGEVETTTQNLFYYKDWRPHYEIISIK